MKETMSLAEEPYMVVIKQYFRLIMGLRLLLFLSILVLASGACNKQTIEEVEPDLGYDYFPLTVGKYWIYESDSILYDPVANGTEVILIKTYIKEEIIDTILDNSGETLYTIERSERQDLNAPWEVKRQLWLSRNERQAFRNEDNLRFINLVFPPEVGTSWDGNLFFDETLIVSIAGESIEMFKSWFYEIRRRGEAFDEEGLTFPDVLEVSMADNENLIERRFAREIYAKDIGLVYRELLILDTQCEVCCNLDFAVCEGIPWEQKAEKGFILRQKIIEYN